MGANFWVVMPRDVKAYATTLPTQTVTPIVRLREQATVDSLIANLRTVAAYQTSVHGHGRIEFVYISRPVREQMMDAHSGLNWLLAVAAAVVLIIACSNLANLVLARGLVRRHEMAVRMSLGARRADLVRDVIAECLVIALAGAALGMVAAAWGFDIMRHSMPGRIPYAGVLVLTMNWRVIALSVGAAVVSAVLFGLLPALRLSNIHLAEHVKEHAGTTTARRRGRFPALVIGQVALSLALLTGVSLLLRASAVVRGVDLGFDPSPLATVSFWGYARGDTTLATRQAVFSAVETRLRGTTGVDGVAWTAAMGTRGGSITGERSGGAFRSRSLREYDLVHPDYLRVVGIRVIRGRDFAARDALGEGSVIIDSATALRVWGSEDPIGKLVKFAEEGRIAPWYRVVGVSRPIRPGVPEFDGQEPPPQVFLAGGNEVPRWASFVVRTRGATSQSMLGDLRAVVRDALPPRTQTWARQFDEDRQMLLEGQRFLSRLFGTFGLIALALCALGLYSVLAHSVSQRTREHGIRVALGATPRLIFRDVLREGGVLVLGGTALGGFATIWTNKLVDPYISMLYHVDALALIAAESVLVLVALLAILRPALRATRSDPVEVLRAA
jgi:predicted permease